MNAQKHRVFEKKTRKLVRMMNVSTVEDRPSSVVDDPDPVEPDEKPKAAEGRRISLSVRGLSVGALIVALVAALSVMTWLYIGANHNVDAQAQQARDNEHAEQVALDYAVRAAIMDYKDLGPWKRALVEGTTPELSKKLTDAANAMEQILLPLQWSATSKPIAAKVRTHDKGIYVVDAFVSVMTKTVQAQDNLQSTATYAVTIDPGNGWVITDVGGIGQVVGDK
jgi:Mce-associated membrane protein